MKSDQRSIDELKLHQNTRRYTTELLYTKVYRLTQCTGNELMRAFLSTAASASHARPSARELHAKAALRDIRRALLIQGLTLSGEGHLLTIDPDGDIFELPWSGRASTCLSNYGITTVNQLAARTPSEMIEWKNFGHGCLMEVRGVLKALGRSLTNDSEVLSSKADVQAGLRRKSPEWNKRFGSLA
jgi:hypothetical protein